MEELRSLVLSQAGVIKPLGEKVLQGTPPQVQTTPTKSVMTKPRDVPKLCLEELVGLEATGRLALFFEGIEQCTPPDSECVKTAKQRVSQELALLLQNRKAKGKCTSWEEVKEFLRTEFAVDLNLDRAWRSVLNTDYEFSLPFNISTQTDSALRSGLTEFLTVNMSVSLT